MGILDDIGEQAELNITEDHDSGNDRITGARVGRTSSSGKAVEIDVKGHKTWVPLSQIQPGSVELREGNVGTIVVPKWLGERIEQEKQGALGRTSGVQSEFSDGELDDIRLGNVVALRETGKALMVRIPGARSDEIWIPKKQIRTTSEVLYDGDRGTLVISHWIAQEKGLLGISEARGSTKPQEPDDDLAF